MAIQFPIVPTVSGVAATFGVSLPTLPGVPLPGIPPINSFPGAASIVGSIQGNVLTVTQGLASVGPGLSLSGIGINPGTLIAGPLQSIQNGVGTALVNVQNTVSGIAMQAVGSLNLGSLGDAVGNISSVLTGDASDLLDGLDSPTGGDVPGWGIFLDGQPAIVPDSIIGVDFKRDWHIADYPIEDGGFESYNKVRLPYDSRITMVKGGTSADRNAFLAQLEAAAKSLNLYTVMTPEVQYENANIVHFDYTRRSTNGATLLTVSVWLQEVRVEASTTFTNTASPSAADQVVTGAVQAAQATAKEVTNFATRALTGAL